MERDKAFSFTFPQPFNSFNLFPMQLNPLEGQFIKHNTPMIIIKPILLRELLD